MSSRRSGCGKRAGKLEPVEVTEFDAEEEADTRVPLKTTDPRLLAAEEIDAHNLTHLLYRSLVPSLCQVKRQDCGPRASRERQAGSGDSRGLLFHGVQDRRDHEVHRGCQGLQPSKCHG